MILQNDTLPSCLTPSSNTGLNLQAIPNTALTVRPDWLQGTFRFTSLKQLHEAADFISDYTKEAFTFYPQRGRFMGKQWSNSAEGVEGCLLLYNLPDESGDGLGHAFVSFTGSVLSRIECRDIWRLMSGLCHRWQYKVTRFDIAVDDFAKSLTFEQITDALNNKNYRKFKKTGVHTSKETKNAPMGWTINMGSRKANRLTRIYDKQIESKGRINSIRIEAEMRDEVAEAVLSDWLEISPESFELESPRYLGGIVVGSIDFVDASADRNISRCPKLDWWQQFINKIGNCIRHSFETLPTSYERKRQWITKQVSCTLAAIRKVMGRGAFRQYINRELELAEQRFTNEHINFIELNTRQNQEAALGVS